MQEQTYPQNDYEVIVVDNGSTDGTKQYIQALFQWVKLLDSSRKGSGYARNVGILAAAGEVILSTDSDCVADREWIRSMVEALDRAAPNIGGIAGEILPYSTQTLTERYKGTWVGQPDFESSRAKVTYCATPNAAFRRAALSVVGGFDGAQGFDDTDLGIRLQRAGYQVAYSRGSLVKHRNPASLGELYGHKRKYGIYNVKLALKHPELFGDPTRQSKKLGLLAETLRRVIGDLTVKLAKSLFSSRSGRPRCWPIVDATIAAANYHGFCQGVALARSGITKGMRT